MKCIIQMTTCLLPSPAWATSRAAAVVPRRPPAAKMGLCFTCCVKDGEKENFDTATAYRDLVRKFNNSSGTASEHNWHTATFDNSNDNYSSHPHTRAREYREQKRNLIHNENPEHPRYGTNIPSSGSMPPASNRDLLLSQAGSPPSPGMGLLGTTNVSLENIRYVLTGAHVKYVLLLKFSDIPNPGWEVSRRFRQFVELHEQLLKIYPSRLPELPKKRMRSNNSEVAKKRQIKLRIYIEQLLSMDIKSPLLYDFLGIPT